MDAGARGELGGASLVLSVAASSVPDLITPIPRVTRNGHFGGGFDAPATSMVVASSTFFIGSLLTGKNRWAGPYSRPHA